MATSFVIGMGLLMSTFAPRVLAEGPLTDQIFHYPDQIPYKVDTDPTGRGPQFGFNICNSTTEGQNSNCQLGFINSIDDFCLWGPADPNSPIANEEAKTVAWCSKPGHGARTIPAGTLTGVQFLKAPAYLLVTGHIKQENVNIPSDDDGGELDPHGDDQRGNPLGGLVYTNGFPSNNGNNNSYQQVIEWHNFMGSNIFCFKVCDPAVAGSKAFCNNVFDRTGCGFVAPAAYEDGVFETCLSDNQDPVGVYTTNGVVTTYKQPAEGVPIDSLPSVKTPLSSSCSTYASSDIYAAAGTVSAPGGSTTSGSSSSSGTGSSSSSSGSGSITTTTSHSGATTTTGSHASSSTSTTSTGAARVGAQVPVMGVAGVGAGPLVAVGVTILAGLGAVLAGL